MPDPKFGFPWVYLADGEHDTAFYVPGHGWYGGICPSLAKFIVETVNEAHQQQDDGK